jgi:hypothetical protein
MIKCLVPEWVLEEAKSVPQYKDCAEEIIQNQIIPNTGSKLQSRPGSCDLPT